MTEQSQEPETTAFLSQSKQVTSLECSFKDLTNVKFGTPDHMDTDPSPLDVASKFEGPHATSKWTSGHLEAAAKFIC